MTEVANFQADVRRLLRERTLDAARDLVCTNGWNAVNMSQVARRVGVSRPVLYNEVGTRQDLAVALIERETDVFMAGIVARLAEHKDDIVEGLTSAARFTLRFGEGNALLRTILAGEPNRVDGLLPLVVTEPEPVLGRAVKSMSRAIRECYPDVLDEETARVVDEVFVRLTLSHLLQPRGSIDDAVMQIEWVVAGLVGDARTGTGAGR